MTELGAKLYENMVKEISGGVKKEGKIPPDALVSYLRQQADKIAEQLQAIPQEDWEFAEIIVRVYRKDPAELVLLEVKGEICKS